MKFRYLRDPLFLFCVAAYFVNRFVLKNIWSGGFVHEHLNALICIPFWVPIMLLFLRRVRLRPTDAVPHAHELVVALLAWSVWFEILLPRTTYFGRWAVSDHLDIVYYALGAFLASITWRWWYKERTEPVEQVVGSVGSRRAP